MKKIFFILYVFGSLKYTYSQYLTIGANRKPSKSSCDVSSKSALVEHFFNIIFTEFHNTPPVCVCVQMCPDQPTYCYPNGCLKKEEKNYKKPEAPMPVTKLSENTKPIFFIDEKNDFMNDFLSKNYIDDSKVPSPPVPIKPDKSMTLNLRPDPFKDRYKILFKYKKMPKVEMKYNLGEQVMAKNIKSEVMKSESVDVSKTRWPMNKIDRRLVGVNTAYNQPHLQRGGNSRYFMSIFPDKEVASYPPKYFKRELVNNTNSETDDVDIKAIYVVGKTESADNTAFSLEKLIDSLIESSFDNNSTTNAPIENNTQDIDEVTRSIYTNNTEIKDHSHNETTNIISMNFTNENIDKNKYTDDFINANHSSTFSEMIATLSKRIDKQNNTSLEMMRRITGDYEFDAMNITVEKPIETTTITTITTTITSEALATTTESTTSLPTDYETKTTKKGRQRLVRRLQHSKNN